MSSRMSSAATLAAIVESSDDAIVSKTLEGIVTSWNRGAERLFGYTAEEMLGQPITKLFPPERLPEEDYVLGNIRRGTPVEHFETVRIRKDGSRVDISLTVSPIRDSLGRVVGASKIARDITERRQAEEARQRLAAVVESSDDAIITKTLEGIITSWNRAAERMYGYTAAEAIGKPVTMLMPKDRQDEEPAIIERLKRGERIDHYETVRRRKDGTLLNISLTVSPIRDLSGRIIGASKIARDITEQKRAADSLRQTAERLRLTLEAGGLGDWNWDAATDEVILSDRAAEIFGLTPDDPITWANLRALLGAEDRERAHEAVEKAIAERTQYSIEYRVIRPSGEECWVMAKGQATYTSDGKVTGMIGVVQDITEKRRTLDALQRNERALQKNEEQLRLMANSIPQLAWMAEPDGNIFWYNQRWYEYTGTTFEEMQGWGWQKVHDPEMLPKVVERWQESLRTGQPFEMEFPLRAADGVFRWFLTRVNPMRDASGAVTRWFGTNTDVEQERRAREALKEETRVLELLNETGRVIASELNLEQLLQQVTDAATKLSGAKFGAFFYNITNEQGEAFVLYTLSGAPREAFEKFGLPRATPMFKPTFDGEGAIRVADVLADPRYGKVPPHHGMPKGHLPVRSYLAVPVISRSGEVIGGLFFGHPDVGVFTERSERLVVGVAAQAAVGIDNARLYQTAQREIGERKRVAEDLEKAREELRRHADDLEKQVAMRTASLQDAIAQLEEFSYSVSHDLRAPLRAIAGYNDIFRKDFGDQVPQAAHIYFDKIAQSTIRMERLVNDVLTMSRVARSELKLHPIELQDFVEDLMQEHAFLQEPDATIAINLPHRVIADAASLGQVFSNLISNAVKFVPPGRKPVVMVRSERVGERVRIWVEDNGIGIPAQHRGKLFGMFQRLPGTIKYEGTGIGLAIVRKAVERMGGSVGMEPNQPEGSRFYVELRGVQ